MSENWYQTNAKTGQLAVITGTGGLGFEAAKAMVQAGFQVIVAGRNTEKGIEAVESIKRFLPGAQASFELLDLSSLASVEALSQRLTLSGRPIHVLLNNAGIMSPPQRRTTEEGYELQFGVNYLGHFALTLYLLPLLKLSGTGRVVSVTSLAQHYGKLNFDDLQAEHRYKAGVAYCQSKLAQAMFALEVQRRSDANGWGITSVAAHPGFAATNLFQAQSGRRSLQNLVSTYVLAPLVGHSAADGALPLIHAAIAADVAGGELIGPMGFREMKGPPGRCKYASAALDKTAAARLWELSEVMIDV